MMRIVTLPRIALLILLATAAFAQPATRAPMGAVHEHSAQHMWAAKKVHASRPVDNATQRERWSVEGPAEITSVRDGGVPALRLNVTLNTSKGLPTATARRMVANEDWTQYNRLAFWIRTDAIGFPVLTLFVTLRNATSQTVAEVHLREATNNVTIPNGEWTLVHWEIPHIKRDRVISIDFRPWVNKLKSDPWDRAAFEIRSIELQRVDPDPYEGWSIPPGKIAFSHTGYLPSSPKVAITTGASARSFEVVDQSTGKVALTRPIQSMKSRLGAFQTLDFSQLTTPGTYTIRMGEIRSRPFNIGADAWHPTIAKPINFFYGERCGVDIPGVHQACHHDWMATLGDKQIVMNGGWHDAGDLSQGLINTGEATRAMFRIAAALKNGSPTLRSQVEEEARWGLDWIHKVRFDGGFRIGFASMNIWTNGIIGDEDDRPRAALNNPNVNYIAAAAGAAAYNYLKASDPELARKSLAIAEADWRFAINGIESPETQSTPAFAASPMELASQGIIASVELYNSTRKPEYARKAEELSAIVVASQHRQYVGSTLPLTGFFYTGPDRQTLFHQFHRASDQAPIVALAMLCQAFPNHPQWMDWYSALAIHAEYQKRIASTTEPYRVLPAYLYRDDEWQTIAEKDRYGSNRESYRKQVLQGMPIGNGYHLRNFPVWFTRRGNYGILLSQAKALSAASRLRNDRAGLDLAERQLQWVVGNNPFAQSTMWAEGYDFAPQYSVSVGDLAGELPVGMMTRDDSDAPYWPATNAFVFKEVWVHPSVRWLEVQEDLTHPTTPTFDLEMRRDADGSILITAQSQQPGLRTYAIRTTNLTVEASPAANTWRARAQDPSRPWVAAVIADGNPAMIRDIVGY
ncbi:MAG TPA: glycoside hydrolase family 9 protein [Bryobacteraceae bacterium]|nr:glycoside hydrolase family 9 protein [Bryobacteraceae bacterium]